ncbi:hypothetical protein JNUCC0626_47320 [Lentzea sp. JNUCC 0626]|uniref:hypothetical protein n=1 Tax=Lentzea sp. JNUCC 0626 TaxID=3367513 RepID=UPI00374A4A7C
MELFLSACVPRLCELTGQRQCIRDASRYATIALRTGIHPKIVSSRLGHATVAFTLDTYSADIEDLDRDAAEAVIGLFLPSSARGLI